MSYRRIMFEVKQCPYAGENDKTRFEGINFKDIKTEYAK